MEKLDKLFERFDKKIDRYVMPFFRKIMRYLPLFGGLLIAGFVVLVFVHTIRNKPDFTAATISSDLRTIVHVLNKIDAECNILSFDNQRNYVDFLTVKEFVGSEVGSLNLAHPKKWQGPYINDNPTLQEKLYEIVKTDEGVFVLPGSGVTLPNGLVMGKDIAITRKTSVIQMLKPKGKLNYKGEKLAAHLTFKVGDWQGKKFGSKDFDKISKLLEEFHEAMPYTKNKNEKKKRQGLKYKVELPREA